MTVKMGLRERFRAGEISRMDAIAEAASWCDAPAIMEFIEWIHHRGTVKLKQEPKPKKEKQLNEDGSVMHFKKGRRTKRKRGMR